MGAIRRGWNYIALRCRRRTELGSEYVSFATVRKSYLTALEAPSSSLARLLLTMSYLEYHAHVEAMDELRTPAMFRTTSEDRHFDRMAEDSASMDRAERGFRGF